VAKPGTPGAIYVIAPVHNRRLITQSFVRCLASQTRQDFHLVLVDDGSTDGTAEVALEVLPQTTVIRGRGDWWWAGCVQQARDWLRTVPSHDGDLVLIINDDTKFAPDFLEAARRVMADAGKAMLLAQLWSEQTGELKEVGAHVDWRTLSFTSAMTADDVNCFSTRGLFLRRIDFSQVARFHTRLLPHYGADYALTLRAARRGVRFATDASVRLVGDESATGIHATDTSSVRSYLQSTLSRRSTLNPVYWTTFLVLACPPRHLLRNLMRVWLRFGRDFVHAAVGRER
jgi:GT2 family glycosyltransferase